MTQQDHDTVDRDAAAALVAPAARRFVAALRDVEEAGEIEEMVSLATEDTRWRSTGVNRSHTGADGARRFWDAYRRAYASIGSEFTAVTETTARVALEWTGRGRHHDGRAVRYDGVTVLDLGEPTSDQRLESVRLYFDTVAAQSVDPEEPVDDADGGSMLDESTAASGRSSGLAPQDGDASA